MVYCKVQYTMQPAFDETGKLTVAEQTRRRAILDAATTVFLERGYAGATLDDVAATASASKQTLYRYFGDKEGLFRAVIEDSIGGAESGTNEFLVAVRDTTDVEHDLRVLARQHLRDVLQPHLMQLRRLVIAEADRFPTLARMWFERGPERAYDTFEDVFAHLADRRVLHIDRPRLAAKHFNWLVLSIPLHRALYLPSSADLLQDVDEIADDAVRIFLAAHRSDG